MNQPSFIRCYAAICCALALVACGNNHPANATSTSPSTPAAESVEQRNHQWQQQFDAEHNLRLQVESHLHQQEAARSWWQNAATLCALIALALLLVGATLGSAARHESEKPS